MCNVLCFCAGGVLLAHLSLSRFETANVMCDRTDKPIDNSLHGPIRIALLLHLHDAQSIHRQACEDACSKRSLKGANMNGLCLADTATDIINDYLYGPIKLAHGLARPRIQEVPFFDNLVTIGSEKAERSTLTTCICISIQTLHPE